MTKLSNLASKCLVMTLAFTIILIAAMGQKDKRSTSDTKAITDTLQSHDISGFKFRSIGPALTSGRIADFAVNPCNPSEYYVGVASGNIWKTVNNGNTFEPVFDNYGAYAIGCLALDPKNHNVVWAGTGENNHQRALGYGDGVYKTTDGGKSWKNMGLKESRQIGMIAIHPENTDVVFVAAEGSVWGPGGDRGLYKTTDGGKTWQKILDISENTGVNNVLIHPKDHNIMFATSEQRRRHVFTKIGGGPESAIYKSADGGNTWNKLTSGLPGGDVGGMGIAISPVNTNVIFAIIEAEGTTGGFFRSTDLGESWTKMSDYTASGQYYNKIYCDPKNADRVYSMDVFSQVTEDGGKTWKSAGNKARHVDDHAMWINPANTDHFMIGGDGGIYETYDAGKNYLFKTNLSVTQFYRVNVDDTEPFYWIYGGTQDNNSMGGPSRNTCREGVSSFEWITTLGGDGFWQAIEPGNPDIVYSAYQYGNIFRYDKKSKESIKIRPEPVKGEDTYKWNWNAPFILSPHSPTRLYMAANKVFRSDDRGQSWSIISDDITTQTDRNTWPVMGRYWSVDAVMKDVSTSLYGMGIALDESRIREDLLYVGTDDGVIQVTENAGQSWRKITKFPGVPEYTYVSAVLADRFDENVVYACFDNIKRDDFKPYLLKSNDKGRSWTSIAGNLPDHHPVLTIAQDFVDPDLLFVGTEFGVFFTLDGGKIWTRLKSGIPTIKVPHMVIQERECDLVLATFGRGFYVIDDYSPLRQLKKETREKEARIFPVRDALMYIQEGGRYGQGSGFFYAPNPEFGAVITYYLKEVPKTLKEERQEREKELVKEKKPIPIPSLEELRAEANEIPPYLLLTIRDSRDIVVRKLSAKPSKGTSRINWDLRYANAYRVGLREDKFNPYSAGDGGYLVMPGKYTVTMAMVYRGEEKELAGPVEFTAKVLENITLPVVDRAPLVAFQDKISVLTNAVMGAERFTDELLKRTRYVKQAIQNTPGTSFDLMVRAREVEQQLDDIVWALNGQEPPASNEENWPATPPVNHRLGAIQAASWRSTYTPTQTQRDQYALLEEELPPILEKLRKIAEVDLKELENELDELGAPWTPGRIPEWKR